MSLAKTMKNSPRWIRHEVREPEVQERGAAATCYRPAAEVLLGALQDADEQAEAECRSGCDAQALGEGVGVTLRLTQAEVDRINARNRPRRVTFGETVEAIEEKRAPQVSRKPMYEKLLTQQCVAEGLPEFEREFRFHSQRKWRIDLAWPKVKLAVEIDGAVHRIKERFRGDIEKHQALLFAGWKLLRVSTMQVRNGEAVKLVKKALSHG